MNEEEKNDLVLNEGEKKPDRGEYRKGFFHGIVDTIIVMVVLVFIVAAVRYGIAEGIGTKTTASSSGSSSASASGDSSDAEISSADVLNTDTLQKIDVLLQTINTYYYDTEDVDIEDVDDALIKGMIEGLGDPYTTYYTAEEYSSLQATTSGSYSGIGAGITTDADTSYPMISYVYSDTPAEEAGLQAGDIILSVDDQEMEADMELTEVTSLIKGDEGTTVHITISRDGTQMDFDVTREEIELSTVVYQMLDGNIGYIRVTQFSSNTEEQFSAAIEDLENQGMEAMIVDLRDNGGGVVDGVVAMLDDVLPEGTVLSMEDTTGGSKEYTSDEENQVDLPMAVLVNGNSASASEIFTAAIKDFEWGTIIGTTTYGKGVYQSVLGLTDGSAIKVTVGKFYSPDGYNYNGVGIEPDIELEYENTAGEDADYSVDTDNQIQKAVEVLQEEIDE